MEDWDELDDEPEDDEESGNEESDDNEDDDEDEASEDQLVLDSFDALMDMEGDSDIAQASREALAAITESALALKVNRQAREQREVLEQAAKRQRQEALARKKKERARREAQEKSDQRAEVQRQERARLAQEAQQLARERERLRIEQEQFEARRSEEAARKAAPTRATAHIPPRIPVDPEWPAHKNPSTQAPRASRGTANYRPGPPAGLSSRE